MMRIAVTGSLGQVATSLIEQAGPEFEILLLGRRVFLLEDHGAVLAGLKAARPDVVINAAARIGAPLLQLSTDYVFDGALNRPYREDDTPGPRSAYGRSKLLGERLVAERCANSVIVRTAWLFSPYGANFVRTMLSLNETRDEVSVVADQRGNPTSALDLAAALLAVAARVREDSSPALRGIFHMTGSGEATWADFAEAIFAEAAARGRRLMRVKRITTAEYPTPARRPANSRLDNEKLRRAYGLELPNWRQSLTACCGRLIR